MADILTLRNKFKAKENPEARARPNRWNVNKPKGKEELLGLKTVEKDRKAVEFY